ncbi:MAG: hypothetical protein HYY95_07935 [Candidatus Rokubacteria bacterium]|nr:hypothetical protein [Candidatus Rokubacteria bacterium]MBI3105486.1 hypothetical protein [Candidatus Rokubacteria bacterium]
MTPWSSADIFGTASVAVVVFMIWHVGRAEVKPLVAIKIGAERRAGELLAGLERAQGARGGAKELRLSPRQKKSLTPSVSVVS